MTKAQDKQQSTLLNALMIISMIIGGGSWVSANAVTINLPAEMLTFWMFLLSLVCLIHVLVLLREPFSLDWAVLKHGGIGGLLLGTYMLFFKELESGLVDVAGVFVTSIIPLMTFVLSTMVFGRSFSKRDTPELLVGLVGAAIILRVWTLDLLKSGNDNFLACALLWGLLAGCSEKASNKVSPLTFSVAACGAVSYFFLALSRGIMTALDREPIFWLNIVCLAVDSSFFAPTICFISVNRLGSSRASSSVFLFPLSALLLSWLFLVEVAKASTIAGGAAAVDAVCAVNGTN